MDEFKEAKGNKLLSLNLFFFFFLPFHFFCFSFMFSPKFSEDQTYSLVWV